MTSECTLVFNNNTPFHTVSNNSNEYRYPFPNINSYILTHETARRYKSVLKPEDNLENVAISHSREKYSKY